MLSLLAAAGQAIRFEDLHLVKGIDLGFFTLRFYSLAYLAGIVLGAALLSVDAQELINLVTLAMRHGVTAGDLRDGIYTHPSSTEAFNEVLAATRN